MPEPVIIPYVPRSITVHLGAPNASAANVTVPFPDYVKNVVSSEIYPTWEPSALRANTLAIISYALNRVYTDYYRSRLYDFDITASTAYDQKFIQGRNIYENISELVDEIFNDYLRRQGAVEPLAAKFCNGTTVTCAGLSQWGSQYQALDGANSVEILRSYYGADVEIVDDAPIEDIRETYPGEPLRFGSTGSYVTVVQVSLNRISQNYPAIPKVPTDGVFGPPTEAAVIAFQSIFSLTADSIVGRATWYQLERVYVAVLKLSELQSEGQRFTAVSFQYPEELSPGASGAAVEKLQYLLAVIGEFLPDIPQLTQDGIYGAQTQNAVEAFQSYAGLPVTGVVDERTWNALYDQFASIERTVFQNEALFPYDQSSDAAEAARFEDTTRFVQFPGTTLQEGMQDGEVTA